MVPHKTVDITIQSADASELQERIETYNSKKETISLKAEELL
jgi:hypothetical protein